MPSVAKSVYIFSKKSEKKTDEPPPPPCPASFDDSLEGNGVAPNVGGSSGVTPPRAIHTVEAQITDEARIAYKNKKVDVPEFRSVISLVVNTNGNPTDLCVKSAAGYGLDAEAGKAVRQYRFLPAKKNGTPVAARILIESTFRFY